MTLSTGFFAGVVRDDHGAAAILAEPEGHDPALVGMARRANEYAEGLDRVPLHLVVGVRLGDVLAKSGRTEQAAVEWERSLAEWHRAVPAEFEEDKVAELEQKISSVKRRIAQQKPSGAENPR